jgi:uridylate kinase
MKTIVLSLGGSLIVPEKMNIPFLEKFKKALRKHYKTHKFVIVCGGGTIARKYITALKKEGRTKNELSIAGIRATRMNALFMMQFFGKEANDALPTDMIEVKDNIPKNSVVICGALRFVPESTSDSTAARLANYLNADFINLTNVKGLFTSNPLENRKAKFIPKISWKEFEKMANKIKHVPGQHFVLDQSAAKIIKKHKIKTHIIGQDLNALSNIIKGRKFSGTLIYDK